MTSKPTITPGTPGAARVEYYACREEVEAMLVQGYTARFVYEHIKEQGRVTCSYSALCDYVRGGGKRQHSKGKRKQRTALQAPPTQPLGAGQRTVTQEPKGSRAFDPNLVDTSKLF